MTEEAVKRIVKETISELKRQGLIRTNIVAEVLEILSAYYLEGEEDEQITEALKKIEGDPYYDIITLYFEAGHFHAFDWTYRDYQSEKYISFLENVRSRLAFQLSTKVPYRLRATLQKNFKK